MEPRKWITPFKKQCYVVFGVALSLAQLGLVLGYTAVLLPQLRTPTSGMVIDEASASWIAAIPGIALLFGNFIIPPLMGKYGRRPALLVSIAFVLIGWICIVITESVPLLLIGRCLQGLSMGMASCLSPIMVGEYTSPKNRAALVTCMSVALTTATLTVHTVGSFCNWKTTAMVCTAITFIDFLIVLSSPESPSWLADQQRFEDCRKVFHWLREAEEEDELNKMIEARKIRELETETVTSGGFLNRVKHDLHYFKRTMKKKEFYKPICIMVHIYTLGQWGGINVLVPFVIDLIGIIVGPEVNIPVMVISLNCQRLISGLLAIYLIRKFKRRTMLFFVVGLNSIVFFLIAAYTYAKSHKLLVFDHYFVGIFLLHLHTFCVATGSVPLPFAIAGEIFPLRYRSLSGGISSLFFSLHTFLVIKTLPNMFRNIGIYGAYCIYGGVLVYSLLVLWFLLPETQGRTLQDIEDEFRGEKSAKELKTAQPLMILNMEGNP